MIHTRIDKPLELRRDLLEAAIDSTEILKSYQKMKQFEEVRKGLRIEAKTLFKELGTATFSFEKMMPELPADFIEKNFDKESKPKVVELSDDLPLRRKEYVPEVLRTEDRLDNEINEIRKKIASLRHRI